MKPSIIKCINCQEVMRDVLICEKNGEYIMWCDVCGTILTTNKYDPISTDDYSVPQVTKDTDLPVRRLPSAREF